jgi:hypothetical protein
MLRRDGPAHYRSPIGEVDAQTDDLYARLDSAALNTFHQLHFAWYWKRAKERADLLALSEALRLDACCDELLAKPEALLHPNTNYLRYELFAGALVVRNVITVPVEKRPELAQAIAQYDFRESAWPTPPPEDDAALIHDWRIWLRRDGDRKVGPDAELQGGASLLAAASFRIDLALWSRPTTDWRAESVVFPVRREPWRYSPEDQPSTCDSYH